MPELRFPSNFLWGSATAAHQVEGNNTFNDWWEWERSGKSKELSGEACRHYEKYREDFDLAKGLGHNAHRFSIEWSRIEPQEGAFDLSQLEHYRGVIRALKERNIEPLVTLHHFTNPAWFAKKGGWENKELIKYYLRYVEKAVRAFGADVRFWVTINEPNIYSYFAYVMGTWPPQKRSLFAARKVTSNFLTAHIKAYALIRSIYKKNGLPLPMISLAQNVQVFEACRPGFLNSLGVYFRDREFNFDLIKKLIRRRCIDFIGINYYTRGLVDIKGFSFSNLFVDLCKKNHRPLPKNSLGWDIYPEGLYMLLAKFKRFKLPVYVLENGICTLDDEQRWDYIRRHLQSVHRALEEGVDVRGYIYWSLMDNYEWAHGFGPRFGLVETDYQTFERRVRKSAEKLAQVCRTGVLSG